MTGFFDPTLSVKFKSGEPYSISHYNADWGLIRFEVDGRTAVLDPEWNRLSSTRLRDGFKDCRPSTGDVIRAVLKLPFIDNVSADPLLSDDSSGGEDR